MLQCVVSQKHGGDRPPCELGKNRRISGTGIFPYGTSWWQNRCIWEWKMPQLSGRNFFCRRKPSACRGGTQDWKNCGKTWNYYCDRAAQSGRDELDLLCAGRGHVNGGGKYGKCSAFGGQLPHVPGKRASFQSLSRALPDTHSCRASRKPCISNRNYRRSERFLWPTCSNPLHGAHEHRRQNREFRYRRTESACCAAPFRCETGIKEIFIYG